MVTSPAPGAGNTPAVVPLHVVPDPTTAGEPEQPPGAAGTRRPIIPPPLRRAQVGSTVGRAAGLHAYRAAYHGLRLPWHTLRVLAFAAVGAARITARLTTWAAWTNGLILESQAVAAGRPGHGDAMRAHQVGNATRGRRLRIVAVCAAATTTILLAARFAPWWVWPAAAAIGVLTLARHGKPAGTPFIRPAIVPPAYEIPTPVVITRALGSLGISAINDAIKTGHGLTFVTDVHRDGNGWAAHLDLPHGVSAQQILSRREALASGLRRPLSAVWPAGVEEEHPGRLDLWIGFQDITKTRIPAWPLGRTGTADVFGSVPFGFSPRLKQIGVPLFEVNWLIGSMPGQGKTSTVRILACAAALDTVADLWIHEHSGKGDLEPLAQVSHRYASGLDDEAVAYTARSLRLLCAELERRSVILRKIPREQRPNGKITRALAAQRRLGLRPIVCVIDECQVLFGHPKFGDAAGEDAGNLIRVARAYGIILILATQRPDKDSLPTQVSGNVAVRFCLHVPGQVENDLILGTGAYKSGYRATSLRPKTDAGLGWLRGDNAPQIVRTYYLDLPATEKVAARAKAMRAQAGVLSGYALGDGDAVEAPRSFTADVCLVFGADEKLYSETIAARLRERIPQAYAAATSEAVASQLRALGVPVKDVREPGGGPRKGCWRADVAAVAERADV